MKTIKHTNTFKKSPNQLIIHILTLVKNYYKDQNDTIRIKTYDRALYHIRKWGKPITKGNELSHLEGIGKGMIEKIDTILSSGTLPIIKEKNIKKKYIKEKYTKKKQNQVTSILGFNKIFINDIKKKHGARTIHDFRKIFSSGSEGVKLLKLTHIQELGLKYYEDLNDLIPRDEITYLGNQLKKEIENAKSDDTRKKYTMMVSGSYPSHSKEYSKDIDIIIVRNEEESYSGELKDIIEDLNHAMKLETISLGEKKFMGLLYSFKSNKMRHIDIRFVNLEELPYTWLYYSSGHIFNKLIRDKLKKKGYKLNEYGLYKDNEKVEINVNPEHDIEKVEREIFTRAGMDYKTVKERY